MRPRSSPCYKIASFSLPAPRQKLLVELAAWPQIWSVLADLAELKEGPELLTELLHTSPGERSPLSDHSPAGDHS